MSGKAIPDLNACITRPVRWQHTGRGQFPNAVQQGDQTWTIRVNDFPAEIFYTLFIDAHEVGGFDDWPSAWAK